MRRCCVCTLTQYLRPTAELMRVAGPEPLLHANGGLYAASTYAAQSCVPLPVGSSVEVFTSSPRLRWWRRGGRAAQAVRNAFDVSSREGSLLRELTTKAMADVEFVLALGLVYLKRVAVVRPEAASEQGDIKKKLPHTYPSR